MQPKSSQEDPCVDRDILAAADAVRMAIRFKPQVPVSGRSDKVDLPNVGYLPQYGELLEASFVDPGVVEGGSLYTFRWRVDTFDNTVLVLRIPSVGRAKVSTTGSVHKANTIALLKALVLQIQRT